MSQDPYQLLNNYKYNYGTISKQAVVEQNQTYIAYFDGIGGTGPELIDQTAYFIKYIIDTQGNVTNPEPDVTPSRPQAVALYNLIDNFEPGKNAVIKLIGNDPLLTANPNDDALTGKHTITHVGRISPILVSETGYNIQDYVATMSFGAQESPSPPDAFLIANVSAQFQNSWSATSVSSSAYTDLPYATTLTQYTNTVFWTNSSPEYIIGSSSAETGTRIKVQAKIYVYGPQVDQYNQSTSNILWLQILQNGVQIAEQNFGPFFSGDSQYAVLDSPYIDYTAGDRFKVQYKVSTPDYPLELAGTGNSWWDSRIRISQEYSPGVSGSFNTYTNFINGVNAVYSPYFTASLNLPNSVLSQDGYAVNGGISYLATTSNLYSLYNSGLIQALPSASLTMGFSNISIPFQDVKPGDFIRFEYNKNQVYNITSIFSSTTDQSLGFQITPSLSSISGLNTQIININHFVIYRVINDGTYIVLDIPKPVEGNSFTGIIQPEFISKELTDNYDKIITDLTQKNIIS